MLVFSYLYECKPLSSSVFVGEYIQHWPEERGRNEPVSIFHNLCSVEKSVGRDTRPAQGVLNEASRLCNMPSQQISMCALIFFALLGDKFLSGWPFAVERTQNHTMVPERFVSLQSEADRKPISLSWYGNYMELILR